MVDYGHDYRVRKGTAGLKRSQPRSLICDAG